MNDVQELSEQETLHRSTSEDLFSNNEYTSHEAPDDYTAHVDDSDNGGATDLWNQLRPSSPLGSDSQDNQSNKEFANKINLEVPLDSNEVMVLDDVDNIESSEVLDMETPETPQALVSSSSLSSSSIGEDPNDDKTMNLNEAQLAGIIPPTPKMHGDIAAAIQNAVKSDTAMDNDKTVPVAGFANRQPLASADVAPKVSFGSIRGPVSSSGSVYAASDATLAQSESLRLAQRRILELEKEVEKYRYENDELATAGDIIRERAESLSSRISALESQKQESIESLNNEILILKGNSQYKEGEISKARLKIEELEGRLKTDFKKIRVRERELENRLELVKAEKTALLRAKDENILDLKRKIDHLQSELDNYRVKVLELNKTIDVNQEQFKRTVRALRLALSNLEVKEESVVPFKKAE